ncbi:2Fe-2S iron-sulfur cluster binding domain-containing protein [Aerosakkonema funiforme]|uniref:2Fe-2S iron-sulfur cluster-binding protein n=1 Tax=Oscillatoriophycideae TaxID=1301283 RepID=UPI002AC8813E|nr:2Fe-2S iron-sulfur cluster binding domain-containing protein [Aerosakkonema funiforme]
MPSLDTASLNGKSQPSSAEAQTGQLAEPVISAPAKQSEISQAAVISFVKSGKEINCDRNQFVLDIAEQEGVDIPSSCRSGTCGTCKQKLLEGEVKYEGEPEALDDSDREQGYILTCISHPVGRVAIDA